MCGENICICFVLAFPFSGYAIIRLKFSSPHCPTSHTVQGSLAALATLMLSGPRITTTRQCHHHHSVPTCYVLLPPTGPIRLQILLPKTRTYHASGIYTESFQTSCSISATRGTLSMRTIANLATISTYKVVSPPLHRCSTKEGRMYIREYQTKKHTH